MKRIGVVFIILSLTIITGCRNQDGLSENAADDKFIVNSTQWGTAWSDVKDTPQLKGYNIAVDDGNRFVVELNDYEYLGQSGKLMMQFSQGETSFPSSGLIKAYFAYDEENEKEIIEEGEKIYGERKTFFSDKNGVENPLNPPAWYSDETVESSLSESEKEEYRKHFEEQDETRIDAAMRSPLVIITVREDQNVIEFQGSAAAVVENLKK